MRKRAEINAVGSSYKQQVMRLLQPHLDAGATQRELAAKLGLAQPNFLSEVLNPSRDVILPLGRVPALSAMAGLTARESLQLVWDYGKLNRKVEFTPELVRCMVRWTLLASKEAKDGKGPGGFSPIGPFPLTP